MATNDCPYFRKNLAKYTPSEADLAFNYRKGVSDALCQVLTSGDDAYWTTLQNRVDGNGNPAWYVDLHSCDQETFMAMRSADRE